MMGRDNMNKDVAPLSATRIRSRGHKNRAVCRYEVLRRCAFLRLGRWSGGSNEQGEKALGQSVTRAGWPNCQ